MKRRIDWLSSELGHVGMLTNFPAMQHEVLLALSGYPGNVFTVCRETGLFEVSLHLSAVTQLSLVPGNHTTA